MNLTVSGYSSTELAGLLVRVLITCTVPNNIITNHNKVLHSTCFGSGVKRLATGHWPIYHQNHAVHTTQ